MDSDAEDESSSDDSLENQRLLEAAVDAKQIILDNKVEKKHTATNGQENRTEKKMTAGPSLRYKDTEEEHELKTTPEFRQFIAKKLSQIMDQTVGSKVVAKYTEINDEEDTGIRLFKASSSLIKDDVKEASTKQKRVKIKRRKLSSSDDSSDEDEKLAAAAVSPDFILKQSMINSSSCGSTNQESVKHNGKSQAEKVTSAQCDSKNQESVKRNGKSQAEKVTSAQCDRKNQESVKRNGKSTSENVTSSQCDSEEHFVKHKKKKKKHKSKVEIIGS